MLYGNFKHIINRQGEKTGEDLWHYAISDKREIHFLTLWVYYMYSKDRYPFTLRVRNTVLLVIWNLFLHFLKCFLLLYKILFLQENVYMSTRNILFRRVLKSTTLWCVRGLLLRVQRLYIFRRTHLHLASLIWSKHLNGTS